MDIVTCRKVNGIYQKQSEDKTVIQINYWLSMKELGQYDQVKQEVEEADYSDKNHKYQLALLAMKEEEEKFFKILPSAIEKKDVTIEQLLDWPILKSMRNEQLFNEVVSRYNSNNEVAVTNE